MGSKAVNQRWPVTQNLQGAAVQRIDEFYPSFCHRQILSATSYRCLGSDPQAFSGLVKPPMAKHRNFRDLVGPLRTGDCFPTLRDRALDLPATANCPAIFSIPGSRLPSNRRLGPPSAVISYEPKWILWADPGPIGILHTPGCLSNTILRFPVNIPTCEFIRSGTAGYF